MAKANSTGTNSAEGLGEPQGEDVANDGVE